MMIKDIVDAIVAPNSKQGIPRLVFSFHNNEKNGYKEDYTSKQFADMVQKSSAKNRSTGELKSFTLRDGNEYWYFTAQQEATDGSGRIIYATYILRTMGKYFYMIQYSSFDDNFESNIRPCFDSISDTSMY